MLDNIEQKSALKTMF